METTEVGIRCSCCQYSAIVEVWTGASSIVEGKVTCSYCTSHHIWNRIAHRIRVWRQIHSERD